jgi:ribosomal protein S18 acetylase RimI-like enzyme
MKMTFIDSDHPLYASELDLRFRVLREPLGFDRASVPFSCEKTCLHVVLVDRHKVLGCVLFTPDDRGGGRLLQMAVDPWLQRQGVGGRLIEFLEAALIKRQIERITLHARDDAIPFYQRHGYRCVGEPFEEVGIPHRIMEKELV